MPRIRTIKPEFWSDKKVASWPIFTRLLFIGLWTAADDYGRGSAEPARLAAELFPYDLSRDPRETLARVAAGLDTLADDLRITLYEVDGETFYEVAKWREHQRVDNAGKPKVPTPCEGVARPSRGSRETRGELPLEQGTGNREQGRELEACASCSELPKRKAREPENDPTPVVFEIQCSGKSPIFRVHQSRIDAWSEAFPGIAVADQIRRAIVWLNDNPKRRKTRDGMPKFLNGWLSRAQDRAGGSRQGFSDPNAGLTIQDRLLRKLASIPITDGSDRE